jgi:hypothetical protein
MLLFRSLYATGEFVICYYYYFIFRIVFDARDYDVYLVSVLHEVISYIFN